MPDYYLRRHGKEWEIGQMLYGKPTPTHPEARVHEPLARYPTQTEAQQRYDQLTGASHGRT